MINSCEPLPALRIIWKVAQKNQYVSCKWAITKLLINWTYETSANQTVRKDLFFFFRAQWMIPSYEALPALRIIRKVAQKSMCLMEMGKNEIVDKLDLWNFRISNCEKGIVFFFRAQWMITSCEALPALQIMPKIEQKPQYHQICWVEMRKI